MTDFDQRPFEGVSGAEFADNPEPRCPCVLLLDTSGSMEGEKIVQLNEGIRTFEHELRSDPMAAKRVEVAVVTFGPPHIEQPFVGAHAFRAPRLRADGDTPMGRAALGAMWLLAERKGEYRRNGIAYYRPWIFLVTDGAPTDAIEDAMAAIREGEESKAFSFYAVGVDSADMAVLARLSVRAPLRLRGLSFREMFVWLSNSLGNVSRSQPGDTVLLANPTVPDGWASTD